MTQGGTRDRRIRSKRSAWGSRGTLTADGPGLSSVGRCWTVLLARDRPRQCFVSWCPSSMSQLSAGQEALPITTLLPDTAAEPILMYHAHAALRLGLVERDVASLLGELSHRLGNHILS